MLLLGEPLHVETYVLKDNTELGKTQKTFQLHFLRFLHHQIQEEELQKQKIENLLEDQYQVVAFFL